MQRHRLRRVLDAADRVQAAIAAQRIVGCAMTAGCADDALLVPGQHAVEQAHGARMRDASANLGLADQHGETATVTVVPRKYSSTSAAAEGPASAAEQRQRAAGWVAAAERFQRWVPHARG